LNQPRLLQRAIKQNVTIRRYVQSKELYDLLEKYFPVDHDLVGPLKDLVGKLPPGTSEISVPVVADETKTTDEAAMDVDQPTSSSAPATPGGPSNTAPSLAIPSTPAAVVFSILPEVEVYLFTLIITTLLRFDLNQDAADASVGLIERIRTYNRRSLDIFSSKAYFYYSLAHEKVNALANIRPMLLTLYRTACVRHDEMGQAVLLNLLLRNYLHYNLLDQAYTLSMRSNFPESASNNQFCRFLYYMGRIQAIQLDYSEAYQRLMTAARKAPQGYANSFSRMVYKLVVLVQLLMGDIPERSIFNQPELRQALKPYLAVTQAVRNGDLRQFNEVVAQYGDAFKADKNHSLVQRLGHNVLKIGLRKISVSYSRVSLQDIAEKLHLPSAAAAEYICSKAIM
jgi:26S proteasome regulatory subunit N3